MSRESSSSAVRGPEFGPGRKGAGARRCFLDLGRAILYPRYGAPFSLRPEMIVLGLILIYVLVALTLAVLFWAGTTWFQGYIYSEPAEQLYWRAPAAGAALTLFLALWGYLDSRAPGRYPGQFIFGADEVKEFKELRVVYQGQETLYKLRKNAQGKPEYWDAQNRPLPSRPDSVIVDDQGEKVRFEAERDQNKNFKIDKGQSLRYVDNRGRSMTADNLGRFSIPRPGLVLSNLLLYAVHLGVWFLCLWLLLRFQWPHALGLAVICWLVVTLTIMPMLLERVEAQAAQRATTSTDR